MERSVENFWLGVRLLLLLTAANVAPIALKKLRRNRGVPLDFNRSFADGRPWLGASKTWRGLVVAMLAAAVVAPALGFPVHAGAALGLLSMVGAALSSFIKRRLGVEPGGRSFGLDQIPEALLPLLVMRDALAAPWPVLAGVTLAFLVLEEPAARWAHHVGLRDRPYWTTGPRSSMACRFSPPCSH